MTILKKKKQPKMLRRTRKKYSNLEKKVKEFILYLRDNGYNKYKFKSGRTFYGYITKEDLSSHFGVKQGEIGKCLHRMNLEGLVSQAENRIHEDGWIPSIYYVYNSVRPEVKTRELKPLFTHDNCPICNEFMQPQKILRYSQYDVECPKNCFKHVVTFDQGNIIEIFGKVIVFNEHVSKGHMDQARNLMVKEIKYWKKDMRYVAKWLTRD